MNNPIESTLGRCRFAGGCLEIANKTRGRQKLCAKHYRFTQMRADAKYRGKAAPSIEELDAALAAQGGLNCNDCGRGMNWFVSQGYASAVSLQHYRSGLMALVCVSCNSRHAAMPEDSFCGMPQDHKRCSACLEVKPYSAFYRSRARRGVLKLMSTCSTCANIASRAWSAQNRSKQRAQWRPAQARRRAALKSMECQS